MIMFRIQESDGVAGEGWQGEGQPIGKFINQIIEEAQETFLSPWCRAHTLSLSPRSLP